MNNQELTQYPAWRLWPIHLAAKLFGVSVQVDGYPFGCAQDRKLVFSAAINAAADVARRTSYSPETAAEAVARAARATIKVLEQGATKN